MKAEIIKAIKNTFGLIEHDDIKTLRNKAEISSIQGLSVLIDHLIDETTPPKVIAEALEQVVLHIKLKNHTTQHEKVLLEQVQKLVYNPLYEEIIREDEPKNNSYRI
jgi:hypothetical protein